MHEHLLRCFPNSRSLRAWSGSLLESSCSFRPLSVFRHQRTNMRSKSDNGSRINSMTIRHGFEIHSQELRRLGFRPPQDQVWPAESRPPCSPDPWPTVLLSAASQLGRSPGAASLGIAGLRLRIGFSHHAATYTIGSGSFHPESIIGNSLCNVFTRSLEIMMAIIGRVSDQVRRETRGFFYLVHGSVTIANW